MREMLLACVLLAGCATPELSTGGARVHVAEGDPAGCRPIATMRESEGGGLRSYEANRSHAETRLRNEAARMGGNAMVLLSEVHGASEEGNAEFATGVAGLSTPNPRCSNCVILTARAYACDLLPVAAAAPVVPAAAPAEPAAAPAAEPPPVVAPVPAEPPVLIIIQPQK